MLDPGLIGGAVDARLATELETRRDRLRPPEVVMAPEMLGAARLTRYSFSRTFLRRAGAEGWTARRVTLDINDQGEGEAIYAMEAGSHVFTMVAFTTTIPESSHTDRVIAGAWEITAALIEGPVDDELMAWLRREVPRQEESRLDARVLVLTRGNRSVRFFDYLVDRLADGHQPQPGQVADAGYIMRSTAFYGNGKCGMRSFAGFDADHPLRAPYRAQFLCAWFFRELSYDVVESCARARGGVRAVPFDDEWRRYFGLGNATGLGLVPYAMKHPRVIHAWAGIRERALADVRSLPATPERRALLERWIERAGRHFADGTADECAPFLNAVELAGVVDGIRNRFHALAQDELAFDALYRWAEGKGPETAELVVSLLLELDDSSDDLIDDLCRVDEHASANPAMTVGTVSAVIEQRWGWLDELDLDAPTADAWWWVISDNTEEPRRAPRSTLAPEGRDVSVDIAIRVFRLRAALDAYPADAPIAAVLHQVPEHRYAVERLVTSDRLYGEPRDNVCAADYLPLQLQRFQLAMYGMDNYKPKSTDWLRVTLYQGAPRLADLRPGVTDDWVFPPRPKAAA